MLHVHIHAVRPGGEARLRAGLHTLAARRTEVRETFRQEGVRHEQAYLLDGADGLLLVYVSECEDPERARAAFAASALPVDAEHAAVMREVLAERVAAAPAFECRLDGECGARAPRAARGMRRGARRR